MPSHAPHSSRAAASCPACSAIASDAQWSAWPLVRVMGANEVTPFVTRWVARAIEIRSCAQCGRNVARMAPLGPQPLT